MVVLLLCTVALLLSPPRLLLLLVVLVLVLMLMLVRLLALSLGSTAPTAAKSLRRVKLATFLGILQNLISRGDALKLFLSVGIVGI